jgi:hypothetical protein
MSSCRCDEKDDTYIVAQYGKVELFTMMPGSSIANEDDIDGSDLAMISGGGSILFCGLAIAVTCTVIQTGSR